MTDLEFRMLGPFEVCRGGEIVPLGPGRAAALLAMLLIHANEVVAADRLVEELWAGEPPATAPHALQVHVSSLRKLLGAGAIVTRRPGYLLPVPAGACDAVRFESLLAEGGRALEDQAAADALRLLGEALALWRGPVLADLADQPFVAEATRLEELRLVATERWVDAGLALGRHAELVSELEGMVRRYPLRENLWSQLIVALYRSGRQADALRTYQRLREVLAEELGLEPSPELRRLEGMVLRQDRELAAPAASEISGAGRAALSGPVTEPGPDAAEGAEGDVEEVRVVTALFADLVGSTPLAEQLAPEELSLIVNGAVERMASCAGALEGTVASRMGDGILALFGDRAAHEDDAERAVRAGLRILEEVAAYGEEVARSWDVDPLQARVGIDSGPVVVGRADAQVLGDALNTAARLQAAASPGSALASAAVRHLTAELFDWGLPQQLSLKGKELPVEAAEVLAARAAPGKVRGLEGRRPPLVGREAEMATARRTVDVLLAGTGGILVVTGDAGAGKSRFLAELRELVERSRGSGRQPLWLEGRCLSWGASLVYGPFRELLREWLGASPAHPALRTRVTLRRKLDELFGPDATQVAGFLSSMLGLPLEPEASEQLAILPPEAVRQGAFGAVRDLLARLADNGPVVVALDDLHWADTTSLQLLADLLPVTDAAAVLLVLAMRPEREHGSWRLRETAQRELAYRTREVTLDALPAGTDAQLLDELLGPGALPPAIAAQLLEAARGNPFFIEELVRSLLDVGALRPGPDGWEVADELPVEIPRRVESVLSSRLDRLPGSGRAVLGAAAVLGRQFPLAVLAQVCAEESDLEGTLVELQQLELIEQARRWPAVEYRFRHPLVADAAYRRLVADRRRELHRRAADVLQTLSSDRLAESYGVLAHHHEQAGDGPRAVAYHRLAAEAARRADALPEAARHCTAALGLIAALSPEEAQRERALLEWERGHAWWHLADHRAGDELRRALASARAAGDGAAEMNALVDLASVEAHAEGRPERATARLEEALDASLRLGDTAAEVAIRNRLTVVLTNDLDLAGALVSGEEALAAGRRAGDEALAGRAMDGLKLVAFALADWPTLRQLTVELEGILRRHHDRWYLQYLLAESAYAWAGEGDWDGALARLDEAQSVNAGLGDRFTLPYLLTLRAWLERSRARYPEAVALGRDAATVAGEGGTVQLIAWSETNLGAILAEAGGPEEAVIHLEVGWEAARQGGVRIQAVRAAAHLARAGLRAGENPAVERHRRAAEDILESVRCPAGKHFLYGLDAYLALAEVALAQGDVDGAAGRIAPLRVAAEAVGWKEGVARTCVLLGRVAAVAGRGNEAAGLARHALEAATAGGLPAVAAEAERLLHGRGDE
jgi:DNA-binding SARP family transcriptional activator